MTLIKNIWHIGKDFFIAKDTRIKAVILLLCSIIFQVILVYGSVVMNSWYKELYSNLQELNASGLIINVRDFCIIVFCIILVFIIKFVSQSYLAINWRRFLTEKYIDNWLNNRAYQANHLLNNKIDNPDQRISQDINLFTEYSIGIFFSLFEAVMTLASFSVILWNLSGSLKFSLFNQNFQIQGYMFWAAIIYCVIGTFITFKIGRKLVSQDYQQERKEANFRFSLMRIRENSNAISLYQSEAKEKSNLKSILSQAIENSFLIIKTRRNLGIWVNIYNNFANIFPILIAAPRLFAKEIQLGELMQTVNAFNTVKDSLSVLVENFKDLSSYRAVIARLIDHDTQIKLWNEALVASKITITKDSNEELIINNLSLNTPLNRVLFNNLNLKFSPKNSYLIKGANGCGKSTLASALAGFWIYGEGEIILPKNKKIFFIPQKTFMNNDILLNELSYPNDNIITSKEEAIKHFENLNLSLLIDRLDNQENWSSSLSVGEQQKIALIRAIIAKPDILILDEASSALNPHDEEISYKYLREQMPDACIISIGHRESLTKFHNHEIILV